MWAWLERLLVGWGGIIFSQVEVGGWWTILQFPTDLATVLSHSDPPQPSGPQSQPCRPWWAEKKRFPFLTICKTENVKMKAAEMPQKYALTWPIFFFQFRQPYVSDFIQESQVHLWCYFISALCEARQLCHFSSICCDGSSLPPMLTPHGAVPACGSVWSDFLCWKKLPVVTCQDQKIK